MELPSGKRLMVVERKGKDIWRGRHKSLHEAIKAGDAGIGIDRVLIRRAMTKHDVVSVMIIVEEMGKLFTAAAEAFFDEEKSSTKTGWDGAAQRVLGYHHFVETYLGPSLRKHRKRVMRVQNNTHKGGQ